MCLARPSGHQQAPCLLLAVCAPGLLCNVPFVMCSAGLFLSCHQQQSRSAAWVAGTQFSAVTALPGFTLVGNWNQDSQALCDDGSKLATSKLLASVFLLHRVRTEISESLACAALVPAGSVCSSHKQTGADKLLLNKM